MIRALIACIVLVALGCTPARACTYGPFVQVQRSVEVFTDTGRNAPAHAITKHVAITLDSMRVCQ
jgi:hypothetical protein